MLTVPLKVVQAQGVLLKKDVSTNLWRVWNRAGEMVTGDELACPEPFEATLEDAAKELRITLLGDTRLEWLAPAGEARVQMQLDRGRVVFVWQAGNDQSPVVIRIGKSAFRLEPQEAGGTCGVEVIGRGPVGFERQPPPPGVLAVLHVAAARIRVVPDQGEPVTVSSGARWPLIGPLTEDELVSPSGAWLDPSQRTTVFPLRRFASRFEKLFDPQISAEQALAPLYRDPHPILAELATRGLALLDQTDDLVQALAESSHVEVRRAAVHGLRQWLARTTDGGQSVLAALLRRYPTEQDARLVYRLLWGLSLTDGQDSMLSQGLVELLTDNRVEIRELAFEQMVKLTGRRYDYQPLASPSSRLAGQQRWRQHLEREGGALVRPR
ncbi:MAG: hypothetical protein KatS3mg114_1299 [Planctomycetaceae bacterium]|nr:MAG: hypothetical protein KatS3mg114_1299 [Planctomycetaceae bacterium]